MKVEAHWAIYDSRTNDGLRLQTCSQQWSSLPHEVRQEVEDFADRTMGWGDDQTNWPSYFSGRRFGDSYVITHTRQDLEAKRPGSVVTHAILVDAEIAGKVSDLEPLLDAASSEDHPTAGIMLDVQQAVAPAAISELGHALLVAFARAPGQGVAVLDENLWKPALLALWAALWPSARNHLHFRAFRRPIDRVDNPDLIFAPTRSGSWCPPEFMGTAMTKATVFPSTPLALEQHLIGAGELHDQLVGTVADVRPLNVLCAALRDRSRPSDAINILTQLGTARIREDARGTLIERQLTQLSSDFASLTGDDLKLLLGVDPKWTESLSDATETWLIDHFSSSPDTVQAVVATITTCDARHWGHRVLKGALQRLPPTEDAAAVFLTWWKSEALYAATWPELGAEWDDVLTAAVGSSDIAQRRQLDWTRKWPRFFGTLVAQARQLEDLLQVAPAGQLKALHAACSYLGGKEFLEWAVEQDSAAVQEVARNALTAEPALLAEAPLENPAWLELWSRALPQLQVADPGRRFQDLLGLLVSGKRVPQGLLEGLAVDNGSTVLRHQRREHLLHLLPDSYLTHVADAFLRSDSDHGAISEALKQRIRDRVKVTRPTATAAAYLLRSDDLGDEELSVLLSAVDPGSLDADDVKRHLKWREAPRRSNILHVVPARARWILRNLLPPGEQLLLAETLGLKLDEPTWWSAFHEVVANSRIDVHSLWDTLDVSTKDLPDRGSPDDKWLAAIEAMRRKGTPNVWDVLHAMERRRPDSSEVRALLRTCPF